MKIKKFNVLYELAYNPGYDYTESKKCENKNPFDIQKQKEVGENNSEIKEEMETCVLNEWRSPLVKQAMLKEPFKSFLGIDKRNYDLLNISFNNVLNGNGDKEQKNKHKLFNLLSEVIKNNINLDKLKKWDHTLHIDTKYGSLDLKYNGSKLVISYKDENDKINMVWVDVLEVNKYNNFLGNLVKDEFDKVFADTNLWALDADWVHEKRVKEITEITQKSMLKHNISNSDVSFIVAAVSNNIKENMETFSDLSKNDKIKFIDDIVKNYEDTWYAYNITQWWTIVLDSVENLGIEKNSLEKIKVTNPQVVADGILNYVRTWSIMWVINKLDENKSFKLDDDFTYTIEKKDTEVTLCVTNKKWEKWCITYGDKKKLVKDMINKLPENVDKNVFLDKVKHLSYQELLVTIQMWLNAFLLEKFVNSKDFKKKLKDNFDKIKDFTRKQITELVKLLENYEYYRNSESKRIVDKAIKDKDIDLKDLVKIVSFVILPIIPPKDIDYTIKMVKEKNN